MERGGYVYIITNKNHMVLYVGVTSDLYSRIIEHRTKVYHTGFSFKYNLEKLVYYGCFDCIEEAIEREKQLKGGSRKRKIELINAMNPEWNDLFSSLE